jgi:hypothetical protein
VNKNIYDAEAGEIAKKSWEQTERLQGDDGKKTNLYKKLSPNTLSYEDMTKIKLNSIKYSTTRITSGTQYSMMYSLDKSRF